MILSLLLACAGEDPCAQMCEEAAALQGSCLGELGWSAAGFEDEDDYLLVCDTWAWEQRQLHAGEEAWQVDAVCMGRRDLFATGTCDDYTSIDWSTWPPDSSLEGE